MKNPTAHVVTLGLNWDLRADPGLWFRKWQRQLLFLLWPQNEEEIATEYEFAHSSSEAWVRVRFVFPRV